MLERENDLMSCSLYYAFHTIGGKWKPYILWYLNVSPTGVCRYGELKRHIPWDISHKMFAQQLKELEDDGIIVRKEYDGKPVRVEYSLTGKGKLLIPVILYLRDWGAEFGEEFGPHVIKRTLGNWDNDTISYSYQDNTLNMGVDISFRIGRKKDDSSDGEPSTALE